MCIAVLSTAHPSYRLILINNRDEYINRPTARAGWWPSPNPHVLGGRDLLRSAQGTWLGITKKGRIAVLTNFREETPVPPDAVSRGVIIRKWLTGDGEGEGEVFDETKDFVRAMVDSGTARDAGGFSLVCGKLGGDEKLAVISNRAMDQSQVPWIAGDRVVQTVGLSNAAFTNHSWKKVKQGEEFMLDVIRQCSRDGLTEDEMIQKFLEVLSLDTLKRFEGRDQDIDSGMEIYIKELRNTIFVPALGRKEETASKIPGDEIAAARSSEDAEVMTEGSLNSRKQLGVSGLYGTQKQTVILVDHNLNVRFFERTLYDENSDPIPAGQGDVDIRFSIER